jgi:hypothetical protein
MSHQQNPAQNHKIKTASKSFKNYTNKTKCQMMKELEAG